MNQDLFTLGLNKNKLFNFNWLTSYKTLSQNVIAICYLDITYNKDIYIRLPINIFYSFRYFK